MADKGSSALKEERDQLDMVIEDISGTYHRLEDMQRKEDCSEYHSFELFEENQMHIRRIGEVL